MKFFRTKLVFLIFASLLGLSACARQEFSNLQNSSLNSNTTVPSAAANVDSTNDNSEDFSKIAKLPFQPEEVMWRETGSKKIVAVLKFSAAAAQNLVTQIENQKPVQSASLDAENWYPPELVAKSQQAGDETLKGMEYSAADFFLAPYNSGKITRINDTNYFILELSVS